MKLNKKTLKQAEINWNYVFTIKKWDEYLPKDVISSIEVSPISNQVINMSENILLDKPVICVDKKLAVTEKLDLKSQNQVDFLYSLWSNSGKQSKINPQIAIRQKQVSLVSQIAVSQSQTRNEELLQIANQSSAFYKISHSRNKVTNSYNYVVRKNNYQFICKEKEAEICLLGINQDAFVGEFIEENSAVKKAKLSAKLTLNNVVIKIEEGLMKEDKTEQLMRKSNRNIKLAKMDNSSKRYSKF